MLIYGGGQQYTSPIFLLVVLASYIWRVFTKCFAESLSCLTRQRMNIIIGGKIKMKQKEIIKLRLLPPSADNPRNSEGSIIELRDGRLFLAYSHFYGGSRDESSAYIAGRFSEDKGKTWSKEDVTVIENEGKQNVMSVTLLRFISGEIGLFYAVKNSSSDCRLYMRTSKDEGKTWSDKILTIPQEGYYVVNNDRVIQHTSGRLLFPADYHPFSQGKLGPGISMCFFSDDKGKTWQKSKTELQAPENSHSGLQEPGIIELKDGSLMMLMRTDLGCQFRSYSHDRGETWSLAQPTDIISPVSPATVKRIPKTGDLLLIWNDHSGKYPYVSGKRTPLCSAISQDEGKTWKNSKLLENDSDGWYCYTSCVFINERAVLSYCAGNSQIGGLNLLQITLVDIDWFYIRALLQKSKVITL